ncbi:MAG: hypothetical protein WDM85_08160 [Caulobacteraceae bacterium]
MVRDGMHRFLAPFVAALLAIVDAAGAAPAPRVSISSYAQLATPLHIRTTKRPTPTRPSPRPGRGPPPATSCC